MTQFKRHNMKWFIDRVGQVVEKEFTRFTRSEVIKASTSTVIQICSEQHARALFAYHRDNKINFLEKESVLSNQTK